MAKKGVQAAGDETRKPATKAKAKPVQDDDAIKLDVKAFASQLGLAAGGANESFDDFAPQKAKQSIGQATGGKEGKAGKQKKQDQTGIAKRVRADEPAAPPPATHAKVDTKALRKRDRKERDRGKAVVAKAAGSKEAAAGSGDGGQKQQQQQVDPKITERTWNTGAGPRPGEDKGFKSLLGRDEHTVWYEALAALPPLDTSAAPPGEPNLDLVEILRQEGEKLVEAEVACFERDLQQRNAADFKWLQQVKRSGTTADRVAAMTLMIRESVLSNLKSLDTLLSWVQKRKGGKDVVRQAIEALQELALTVLLPNRKLKFLEQQPLQYLERDTKDGRKRLLYWYVEDAVKRRYAMYITALEECSKENLEFLKEKATKSIYDLLCQKPEGEAKLLTALTNKLGDPSRKVASKAGFLLGQLLMQHPAMKPVVVRETERFLFRPGLQERARYYAIVFLNQLVLSHKESEGGAELAKKLVELYFTLFRMVIEGHFGRASEARKVQQERRKADLQKFRKQQAREEARQAAQGAKGKGKGKDAATKKPPRAPRKAVAEEMDARMLGALIAGVRRAFPFVAAEEIEPLVQRSGEQLFKIVHAAPFTVGVQALMLMYQLMASQQSIPDRFYRALYAVLLTDGPSTSSKAPMFLALLFKAMKSDTSVKRVAAMAKRLLQSAHNAAPNFACAVLFMLSEVLKVHAALWSAILQPEDVGAGHERFKDVAAADSKDEGDDGLETFKDVVASSDEEGEEQAAAVGKAKAAALRVASGDGGNIAQRQGQMGGANGFGKEHHMASGSDGDGDDEGMQLSGFDALGFTAGARGQGEPSTSGLPHTSGAANGVVANGKAGASGAAGKRKKAWPQEGYYDMSKREPLYSDAERACWWELASLASHVHPSVAAMARTLMSGQPVLYDGDPLRDHSLTAFLDKFLQKKPRAHAKGSSLMQPLGRGARGQDESFGTISSAAFVALAESKVEPAELFFHRFYNLSTTKSKRDKREEQRQRRREDEADEEGLGVDSDEDPDIDRLIEREEKGLGGNEDFGNPDIGYDYESLADAMMNDNNTEDEEGSEDAGSAGEEGGEGEEGDQGQMEDDGDGQDDDAGADGLDVALDALEDSDEGGSEDSESGFELAPGAAEFLASGRSAGEAKGKGGKGQGAKGAKASKQRASLPSAADDDEDMDDVNVLDLPSPGSEEEEGDAAGAAEGASSDEPSGSDDGGAGLGGSDDDDDGDLAALLAGEESDEDDGRGRKGAQGKGNKRRRKDAEPVFASADDYEHLFRELDEREAKEAAGGSKAEKTPATTPVATPAHGLSKAKQRRGSGRGRGGASVGKHGGRGGRGRGRPGSQSV